MGSLDYTRVQSTSPTFHGIGDSAKVPMPHAMQPSDFSRLHMNTPAPKMKQMSAEQRIISGKAYTRPASSQPKGTTFGVGVGP